METCQRPERTPDSDGRGCIPPLATDRPVEITVTVPLSNLARVIELGSEIGWAEVRIRF